MTKRKSSKIKHSKSDVSAAKACPDIYMNGGISRRIIMLTLQL